MEYSDTLSPRTNLVDEYEVIRILGSGGFGNTYLAHDVTLNREVAIKEYYPREIAVREDRTTVRIKGTKFDSSFQWGLERFVQEAKLLAKFRHPNIVRVFRTFDANGTAYIVLDYVKGTELEGWLVSIGRRPTQQELDELLTPLLDALELVHANNILHRDIKPANVCVREETGDPILLDFGASKYSMSELTGTTAAIVSRGYSPYEAYAADSKSQGPWTDIYGLGATIYRALTNAAPPEATERLLDDTIIPLKSADFPGYRPGFLAAVNAALSVQPKDRPQSVAEWRSRLFTGGETVMRNWGASKRLLSGDATGPQDPVISAKAPAPVAVSVAAKVRPRSSKAMPLLMLGSVALVAVAGAIGSVQLGLVDRQLLAVAWQGGAKTTVASVENASPKQIPQTATPAADQPPKVAVPAVPAEPPKAQVASAVPSPAEPPVRAMPPLPRLEYKNRVYGKESPAKMLTVAAVSADGRLIAGGDLDGSLKYWNLENGRETEIGPASGNAVLALDFVGPKQQIVAAMADGTVLSGGPGALPLKTVRGLAVPSGFIKAVAYSATENDIVLIATSEGRTQLTRWRPGNDAPYSSVEVGSFLARSAAIARDAHLAVVVNANEKLISFDIAGERSPAVLDYAPPVADWTSALAISPDGKLLARGGMYSTVTVIDLNGRQTVAEVNLPGEQMQTRALAFSRDGRRLAVAYQTAIDRVMQTRIRVIAVAGGDSIDIEGLPRQITWLSFLPSEQGDDWLAMAAAGTIRVCELKVTGCPALGPVR